MEWLIGLVLVVILAYVLWNWNELGTPILPPIARKRLCDYYVNGSVFEDVSSALARGVRLIELHVYSDERNEPIVAKTGKNRGVPEENVSFEQCCVDLVNDAFPSKDPLILSIVPHTRDSFTMNRVAEHLQTTLRRHLISDKDIECEPLDKFANKVILVSEGGIGTEFDQLVNLSWTDTNVRRLSYQQALYPRDEDELIRFNRDHITIVGTQVDVKSVKANPKRPLALGCQWNFTHGPPGFVEKPEHLQ